MSASNTVARRQLAKAIAKLQETVRKNENKKHQYELKIQELDEESQNVREIISNLRSQLDELGGSVEKKTEDSHGE